MIKDRSARRCGFQFVAGALALSGALAACSSSSSPPARSSAATTWSVGTPTGSGSGNGSSGAGGGTPGVTGSSVGGGASGTAAGDATAGGAAGSGAAGPGTPGEPAQPGAEASRDGIPPAVAALPRSGRVRQVPPGASGHTRATSADGVWMISRPAGVSTAYAEVLHLDAQGRILRAYPFPGVAPGWLLLTPAAVYCGRHGESGSPDAMVCRIDRATGDLRVRVAADLAEHTTDTEQDLAGRPGSWVLDDRNFTVDLGVVPVLGTELVFSSRGGVLRLDPDTLAVLGS